VGKKALAHLPGLSSLPPKVQKSEQLNRAQEESNPQPQVTKGKQPTTMIMLYM